MIFDIGTRLVRSILFLLQISSGGDIIAIVITSIEQATVVQLFIKNTLKCKRN